MISKKTRSFLKWAGNKYRCLQHILPEFPKATRLIEPFSGSGSIFMNTHYEEHVLAESNLDLIVLFQSIKTDGLSFINYCHEFFIENNNQKKQYYNLRDAFNDCCPKNNPELRAALFLYLNRHGYNGLCRYNQNGMYNVPFGLHKKPYFPHQEMLHFHQQSNRATIIHSDFKQTFLHALPGDVIYCDPPYVPIEQQTNFTAYTGTNFSENEQINLANLANEFAQKGVTVLISNHDTPLTRHYYKNATIKSFPVTRNINCKQDGRMPAQELLAKFV